MRPDRKSVSRPTSGQPYRAALPQQSLIADAFKAADLADAYAIALPPSASSDVVVLARAVLTAQPAGVATLMAIRDAVMARFGVKTSTEIGKVAARGPHGAVGVFSIQEVGLNEVVMAQDDTHLNFRTSMLLRATDGGRELVWISAVHCNNNLGRLYLALVRPFHARIVPASLKRAGRLGWPQDPT